MKYEQNSNEMYAEDYLKMNGFEIVNCRQYVSKTIYFVTKNEIELKVEIPYDVTDIKHYMKCIDDLYQMKLKLKDMMK